MVTYLYYKEHYGGADIPEEAFARWAMRAAEQLSADTMRRSDAVLAQAEHETQAAAAAQTIQSGSAAASPQAASTTLSPAAAAPEEARAALTDAVFRAVCALAELLYAEDAARLRNGVAKETVGSWSRTYAAETAAQLGRKLLLAEVRYLGGTGLLYRGCGA